MRDTKSQGWDKHVITKVIRARSIKCESKAIKETGGVASLQSSQPTEWVTKVLVQIRIATETLDTIEETIQTITMVCCWVEVSVLITIVEGGPACARQSFRNSTSHERSS